MPSEEQPKDLADNDKCQAMFPDEFYDFRELFPPGLRHLLSFIVLGLALLTAIGRPLPKVVYDAEDLSDSTLADDYTCDCSIHTHPIRLIGNTSFVGDPIVLAVGDLSPVDEYRERVTNEVAASAATSIVGRFMDTYNADHPGSPCPSCPTNDDLLNVVKGPLVVALQSARVAVADKLVVVTTIDRNSSYEGAGRVGLKDIASRVLLETVEDKVFSTFGLLKQRSAMARLQGADPYIVATGAAAGSSIIPNDVNVPGYTSGDVPLYRDKHVELIAEFTLQYFFAVASATSTIPTNRTALRQWVDAMAPPSIEWPQQTSNDDFCNVPEQGCRKPRDADVIDKYNAFIVLMASSVTGLVLGFSGLLRIYLFANNFLCKDDEEKDDNKTENKKKQQSPTGEAKTTTSTEWVQNPVKKDGDSV